MPLNKIFQKKKTFIIAEIGNNHEGSLINAKKLINEAKLSGADAVKFQFFKINKFYHTNSDVKRLHQLKKFSFTYNQINQLKNYSKKKKIIFFSTPLDLDTLKKLNKIQNLHKVASGDNNLLDFIEEVLKTKKPTIISTGLLSLKQINKLYKFVKRKAKNDFALMHCVSMYPTPFEDSNLNTIKIMKKKFKTAKIGYSDHTIGIKACEYAVLLGAEIIEKHFTLDKNFSKFRDHKLSANPQEFKKMVDRIKKIDQLLYGKNEKPHKQELLNMNIFRRSAFAIKNIKKKTKIKISDFLLLRNNIYKKTNKLIRLKGKTINKIKNKMEIII